MNSFVFWVGAIVCISLAFFICVSVLILSIATYRVLRKTDKLSLIEGRDLKVTGPNDKQPVEESIVAVLLRPDGTKKTIQRKKWYKFWK